MLHRYLERDHEQLAELCLQRDQLEQKLSFEQGGTDNSEQAAETNKDVEQGGTADDEKAALPEEEEADLSQGQRFLNNSKPRSQSVITWRRNANSTITKTEVQGQDPNPNFQTFKEWMDKKVGVGESSKGSQREHDPEFQIFVEKFTGSGKKTVALMVRSTTTVREVKEQLERKEGIPAAKQKLRTRGGKFLLQQDLSLKESCVGRQATLVLCPLMS